MPQIFHRSTNTLSRVTIFGGVFVLAGVLWTAAEVSRSPYVTEAEVARDQPVPFSHAFHVGQLGLDCRYCHNGVEKSALSNVPSTNTCMNCHSAVKTSSPLLAPVRASFASGEPVQWVKVHKVPDYVFFNHSAHVNRGVSCVECHGRVDKMEVVGQDKPLSMGFCLDCHRKGTPARMGRSAVPAGQANRLTDCAVCHH